MSAEVKTTEGTGLLEPTEPGWYASADPRLSDYMIFLRMRDFDIPDVFTRIGQWMAFTQSGEATRCDWGYIAQSGPVTRLVKAGADR